MSSPIVSAFQPGSVGTSIARFVLPHALGNAAGDVTHLALRVRELEDQHVLGEPALVARHHATRCAARSTSCRAARCRRSPSRTTGSRASPGSARCTCRSLLHGHGDVGLAGLERHADRVHARDELAVGAEHVERALAHAGHDAHAHGDVRGVGELDADVRDRRAERAHRERHDVERAAAHRARVEARASRARISAGSRQLLVGPASISLLAADERAVLDAGDVAGVAARVEAVRALAPGRAA